MHRRIALIRKKKEFTQDVFADKLNLTKNFISLIETGKRDPSVRTINDICEKFDVNEAWLRTGKGEMFQTEDTKTETDIESDIARLTIDLLTEPSDSFKNRLISALSRLTEEQWTVLSEIADSVAKKE